MNLLRKSTLKTSFGILQQKRDFHFVINKIGDILFGGDTHKDISEKTGLPQKAVNKHFISVEKHSGSTLSKKQKEKLSEMNTQQRINQYGNKFPQNTAMIITDSKDISIQKQGGKVTVSSQLSPIYEHNKKNKNEQSGHTQMKFDVKSGHFLKPLK